jgi:serine/threonine protein kinase
VNALVVDPETGRRQVKPGVIHREDLTRGEAIAYAPSKRLQDAIYGSVWACVVLRRHTGVAAEDAARAAGVEPGSPQAPFVWELTRENVAIKMVEWSRVHQMRGRLLEDPIKEIAALQTLGSGHPHVLGVVEVLQDGDFLYSIMPFCSGGDLFGVVVQYAEESGGEIGMPEPVARYWYRQILLVSFTAVE